jgi:uncharacterized protein YbcI
LVVLFISVGNRESLARVLGSYPDCMAEPWTGSIHRNKPARGPRPKRADKFRDVLETAYLAGNWQVLIERVGKKGRGFTVRVILTLPKWRWAATMKTQGEIENAICDGMARFEHEYMGRGPKDISAHLIGDVVLVRLQGVLTAAEQQLVKSLPAENGRALVKQVRAQLIETARPVLESLIQEVTGTKALSLHHDISTVTGEEFVLFTLAASPEYRETKKK